MIRIGTRVPVTLPQRLFDSELVDLLAEAGKIWIQTHFNHPVEITPEATRACRNLINAGHAGEQSHGADERGERLGRDDAAN